jgi:ParB family chromosome partitioning protein
MKIELAKIIDDEFTVREKLNQDHLEEIKQSFSQDGQWNPIIVRPKGDKYVIISGHYRYRAALELRWKEIEATLKDLDEINADFLSLKANLFRENMTEIEEAKTIKKIMNKYELNQADMAKKLNKSPSWVGSRLSLVLRVTKEVQEALKNEIISVEHVNIISRISENSYENWIEKQNIFLDLIIKNNWSTKETRKKLKYYLNDTIYTIGYLGRDLDEIISILRENKIKMVLDIRFSAESQYKPEFNKIILAKSLEKENIFYEHHSELGLPFPLQNAYKDNGISSNCIKQWYKWHITTEVEFLKLIDHIKNIGYTVLMCMERYAKATKDQKIDCHRNFLTELLLESKQFENRIDL